MYKQKNFVNTKCHRCFRTSENLIEWQDDESNQCFARCNIKFKHNHWLCKKCIANINNEKSKLNEPPKIIKRKVNE